MAFQEPPSTVIKEEPAEEEEDSLGNPSFCYEMVTKLEVMLDDDQNETPLDSSGVFSRSISCPECHRTFSRKRFASQCMRKHKSMKLGLFECEICQKRLATKFHLRDHLEAHKRGTVKMFECEICNKRFTTKDLLENHAEFHSRESAKTFACEVCSKRYFKAKDLEKHKIVHTRGSSQGDNAENTSKRSTKDKPVLFKCVECNASYIRRTLLKACMRKHEALRLGLHECKFCLTSFSTRNGLKSHEARHVRKMTLEITKESTVPIKNDVEQHAKCSNLELKEEDLFAFESKDVLPDFTVVKEEPQLLEVDEELWSNERQLFKNEIEVEERASKVKEEPVGSE